MNRAQYNREYFKHWYIKNKERRKAYNNKYRKQHPEKYIYIKKTKKSIIEKFWQRVVKNEEHLCWEWKGARHFSGYGRFLGKYAHRVSYELNIGPIGDLCVLHYCDNPPCVNPKHLWLGTQLENIQDREKKGRGRNKKDIHS